MSAVEVQQLTRVYRSGGAFRKGREAVAVDAISFVVEKGEIFGLLGPNGAGKTTTIKMLTTLLVPTAGMAHVLGMDVTRQPKAIRSRINFTFGGERGLYWRLSGWDNLLYFSDLYGVPRSIARRRIAEILETVNLADRAHDRVETYSKGMKQRLHLAKSLVNDPAIIFLDEPTLGLDPVGARDLRELISSLKERGKTIFLTTHYMQEADALCDRVAIIRQGRIVTLAQPSEVKRLTAVTGAIELDFDAAEASVLERFRQIAGVVAISHVAVDGVSRVTLQVTSPQTVLPVLLECGAMQARRIATREPSLEDAYIAIVEGASE